MKASLHLCVPLLLAAALASQSRPTTWIHTSSPILAESNGPLRNGDFSDGLNGWTLDVQGGGAAPGRVTVPNGAAVFEEGDAFLVSLVQSFTVPQEPDTLSFTFEAVPGFDTSHAWIPDAFEVQLLDDTLQSVVPTWDPLATSFFNVQEDGTVFRGTSTNWDGLTATVDVRHLAPGTHLTLFLDLIGADQDTASGVTVDGICFSTCPNNQPPVKLTGPTNDRVKTHAGGDASFTLTFGPPESTQNISAIEVMAHGLANFTFDPPTLGATGAITCRFRPDASQITTNGGAPHTVRITAWDDCSTPLSVFVDIDLEVCACPADADAIPYGAGWPGSNGVPTLTATALPSMCGTTRLFQSNSMGVDGGGCLWFGSARSAVSSSFGGTFHVDPDDVHLIQWTYDLPAAGRELTVGVPCTEIALCGVSVFCQAFQLDPGASDGIAFTAGVELVVGN